MRGVEVAERPQEKASGVQRADAGTVRATERDIRAMSWVVEMYALPVDVIQRLTGASDGAVRQMLFRWRKERSKWADTVRMGAGPLWVYALPAGIELFGRHTYAPNVPSAARLRHHRAVALTRLRFEERYADQDSSWRSEREIRWELGQRRGAEAARGHVPDAELEFTSNDGTRVMRAVEVELTPKSVDRTKSIMTQLLGDGIMGTPYKQVIYVATPEARPVVERAKELLGQASSRIQVTDLPGEKL